MEKELLRLKLIQKLGGLVKPEDFRPFRCDGCQHFTKNCRTKRRFEIRIGDHTGEGIGWLCYDFERGAK